MGAPFVDLEAQILGEHEHLGHAPVRFRTVERSDVLALAGSALASFALAWLVFTQLTAAGWNVGMFVAWYATFLLMVWLIGKEQYDAVRARDLVARAVFWTVGLMLIVPMVAITVYTISKGIAALTPNFFLEDQSRVGPLSPPSVGGASQAIVGTLEQVGLATLISVPLGVAVAVFLNEVGGRLARPVRMIVDAMSAIPSIVAGLFIFAAFILALGGQLSGFAAALALAVLMLPTVTRTTEVVLRLVPGGLREAGLALGATEWKTTRHVVLPTARSGIVTAVILGVARVIGETAPLLLTTLGATAMNVNPFEGKQSALPLYVYRLFQLPQEVAIQRAWTGALVLLMLVLVLFVTARLIGGRGPGHIGRLRRARLAREGLA
ncbi:MAG: phosphate ABC transporter permease PstA [Actinomycetes bacterium]